MAGPVEKLVAALSPTSQTLLYTFSKGQELDQSVQFAASSVALQGRDYGYDALGNAAAPVAPRKLVWKFIHPFVGTETYTSIRNALVTAIGQGRPILLEKQLPDGSLWLCDARCTDIPDKATIQTMIWVEYTLTFQQRGDWYSKDITSPRYDTGQTYDSGLHYDVIGFAETVSGSPFSFTITNNGTVPDWEALYTFYGPLTAPWILRNNSVNASGVRYDAGGTGSQMTLTGSITLPSGYYLTVDAKTNSVTSNYPGVVPWTLVTTTPGQRAAFAITPGSNVLSIEQSGTAGVGGSVVIFSRDRLR
ncbi:MAG: hypothetical protein LC793_12230 [Thermomicrobia bacterium]|nr:hypothetical protein [Thermomicrobia bacterium]